MNAEEYVIATISDRKLIRAYKKARRVYINYLSQGYYATASFYVDAVGVLLKEVINRDLTHKVVD